MLHLYWARLQWLCYFTRSKHVRNKKKINFSICGQLQAQRSCCWVIRGQMYHQHRLLSLLQGKTLGSYRGYHRHRLLRILQCKAVEVLHGTDVSSAQVTVRTTGYGCGGVNLYHQNSCLLHLKNMKCKSPGLRGLSEMSNV
jgi:hypothetical protein